MKNFKFQLTAIKSNIETNIEINIKSKRNYKSTIGNSGYNYSLDKDRICVYFHYYNNEDLPFYIGSGTLDRAFRFSSRSKEWKNKVKDISLVEVFIYLIDISKEDSLKIEEDLIRFYSYLNCLVNISYGVGTKGLYKGNNKNSIPIVELDINNNFICKYSSAKEAGDCYNIVASTITQCCKGKRNKYYNRIWKYSSDYYND